MQEKKRKRRTRRARRKRVEPLPKKLKRQRKPKVRVKVRCYGRQQEFRFSFYVYVRDTDDPQQFINDLKSEARKKAIRIYRRSERVMRIRHNHPNYTIPSHLLLENGLKLKL